MNNVAAVRAILLRDWYPSSAGENPNLADDSYILGFLRLIESNCSVDQLERNLLKFEDGSHLRPDPAAIALAARISSRPCIKGAHDEPFYAPLSQRR
jgi:hypothetical protein